MMPPSSPPSASATLSTINRTLSQLLLQASLIHHDALATALAAAEETQLPLYQQLLQAGLLDADTLLTLQATSFGIMPLPLDDLAQAADIMPKLPALDIKTIQRHRVLPLGIDGGALQLAMADITDNAAIAAVRFSMRMPVLPRLIHADALTLMIDDILGVRTLISDDSQAVAVQPEVDDAPTVRFVQDILGDAVRRGASDVHFEPYENSFRVRMRIDGIMQVVATPPKLSAMSIATRLKVLAGMDISERRKPQDGRIKLNLSGMATDFRVSTLPTLFGEKIVLRLMGSSANLLAINQLGMTDTQVAQFLQALKQPQGMIIITGATGSGKSATLYSALSMLNRPEINILSVEDPVEMHIAGINQVNIHPKIGLDFADALRSFLRQDPDVIMVGEIRDTPTAEIATKAAQTGHLLLSTLHTNSAADSITRLVSMGVPRFHLASSLTLIIAQRLARRLCDACKVAIDVPADSLKDAGMSDADIAKMPTIYQAKGCPRCRNGYRGRVGIFELLPVTPAISTLILNGASSQDIAMASSQAGNDSLQRAAIAKLKAGQISLTDMHRITANW